MRRLTHAPVRHVALILFGLSLLVRLATFVVHPHPAYPDSYYYNAVAQALVAGDGFRIEYLWAFPDVGGGIPPNPQLPMPSNAHWTPLASIIQVPFLWLLGVNDFAAALPFMLAAAALAPLTYLLARELLGAGIGAVVAGGCAIFCGGVAAYLTQTDNYALFALTVTGALWLVGRGLTRGRVSTRAMLAAGALTGLSFLSRNDGVLVGLAIGLVVLIDWIGARRGRRSTRVSLPAAAAFAAASLLTVLPWLARQMAVFGTLSPSTASGRILWIRDYNEMFSADGPLSPSYFFSWGWDHIAISRLVAAREAGSLLWLVLFGVVLLPLALVGAARWRRSGLIRPYLVFVVVFLAWAVMVAAPHLPTGNFLHGAVSLIPFGYALAAAGLLSLLRRVRRLLNALRRRDGRAPWSLRRGQRLWGAGLVVILAAGSIAAIANVSRFWDARYEKSLEVVATLRADGAGPGTVLLSANPGMYNYLGGFYGVPTPQSDLDVQRAVAAAYGAEYLVLDRDTLADAFDEVLDGTEHPAWLSKPILTIAGEIDPEHPHRPAMAVYRIEIDAGE